MRWLLTDEYPPTVGGVATWVARTAALVASQAPLVVTARARPGLAAGDGWRVEGVRGRSFGRWGGLWTALHLAGRVRPGDVVVAATWRLATHLGAILPAGVPVHVVGHGGDLAHLDDPAFRAVWTSAAGRWVVSDYLAARVAGLGPVGVLAPPVPPPRVDADRDPRRWVFAGRMVPEKGGDRVLRLAAAHPEVQLVLCGDGPARPGWEALAAGLGLGARARFVGAVSRVEVEAHLATAGRCLLLPRPIGPVHEGFGLILAEAAAHGCVPVGCAVGGVPEACAGGIVLTRPDAVSASLLQLWGPPAPARAVGEASVDRRMAAHAPFFG